MRVPIPGRGVFVGSREQHVVFWSIEGRWDRGNLPGLVPGLGREAVGV
jgi:hypothetical protein